MARNKIKLFNGYLNETQAEVDKWLEDNPNIHIVQIQYHPTSTGQMRHNILLWYRDLTSEALNVPGVTAAEINQILFEE